MKWTLGALLTAGLSILAILLGLNLLPDAAGARAKDTFVPWVLTWIMIFGTAAMGLVVAGFMFMWGTGRIRQD